MRKIKELNEWRESPCSWIGRLCNAMLVIPNLIYRFNATPIKIPENYFMDMDKLLLKVYMERQKEQNTQCKTEREEQLED